MKITFNSILFFLANLKITKTTNNANHLVKGFSATLKSEKGEGGEGL
jgi:hypothetical protein